MKILAVARFTLLRLRRTRYLSAGVILVGIVVGMFLISTARGGPARVGDMNWPLNLARIFAWLAAIWLGSGLLASDRDDGNLRSTLTRPISHIEYFVGKVLGGWFALAFLATGFAVAMTAAGLYKGVGWHAATILYPFSLLPVQLMVLALAAALAQALPRFWVVVLLFGARDGLYTSDSLNRAREFLPDGLMDFVTPVAGVLYWLCPTTQTFSVSFGDFFHGAVDASLYALLLPYSLHYALLACLLGAYLLNRREL